MLKLSKIGRRLQEEAGLDALFEIKMKRQKDESKRKKNTEEANRGLQPLGLPQTGSEETGSR